MATVIFDTHKFVKTLKETGVPESQAEAFSIAVRESHRAAHRYTLREDAWRNAVNEMGPRPPFCERGVFNS